MDGTTGETKAVNIDLLAVSDFAQVSDGKLTIVGIFNVLGGPGPIWGRPAIYFSMIVHGHRDETGRHECEVRLLNQERELVIPEPLKFDFNLGLHRDEQMNAVLPLRHVASFSLFNVQFHRPGAYAFEVTLDGIYHGASMLYVRQEPAGRRPG